MTEHLGEFSTGKYPKREGLSNVRAPTRTNRDNYPSSTPFVDVVTASSERVVKWWPALVAACTTWSYSGVRR
jgi:hypothetical protein